MDEKTGEFFTNRGFFYRGVLLDETQTHYIILDKKIGKRIELLKTTVEKVIWEVE